MISISPTDVPRAPAAARALPAATLALALSAGAAFAQETAALPQAVPDVSEAFRKNVTLLGIPPATVAPDGMVFAAASWTDRRSGLYPQDDASGAVGFGLGLGDGLVDLQFTANVTSFEDDFGDSGYFSVKASRRVDGGGVPTFLGLGVDYLGPWGDSDDLDPGYYASLTVFPVLPVGAGLYPLMLTLGGGDKMHDFGEDPGFFAGAGIGLTESTGASLAYNGDNFDFGASFRIKGFETLGLTAAVGDVFDEDDRRRLILSVNWVFADVF